MIGLSRCAKVFMNCVLESKPALWEVEKSLVTYVTSRLSNSLRRGFTRSSKAALVVKNKTTAKGSAD
jgi:hypothetical protein